MFKQLTVSGVNSNIPSVDEEFDLSQIQSTTDFPTPSSRKKLQDTMDAFDERRFYHLQPTPEIAIISGSSYSPVIGTSTQKTGKVLDACAYRYHIDVETQSYCISIAISDGQGHGIDGKETSAIAQTAQYNCEQFIAATTLADQPPLNELLHTINQQSYAASFLHEEQSIPFSHDPFNRASATLSGVVLTAGDDHWNLDFAQTGDSLTVLLDGQTGEIRFSTAARVFERALNMWSPKGVQQLDGDDEAVTHGRVQAHEGDWIVQMTDGFWGELINTTKLTNTTSENKTFTDEYVAQLPLSTPLQELQQPSDLAKAVQNTVFMHSLETRFAYLNLTQDPEYQEAVAKLSILSAKFTSRQEDENYTVSLWMDENNFSPALRKKIDILNNMASHDGPTLLREPDSLPASEQVRHWQSLKLGDCSTMQVMRIPSLTVCILREWFESLDAKLHDKVVQYAHETHKEDSPAPGILDKEINEVLNQRFAPCEKGMRWSTLSQRLITPMSHLTGLNTALLVSCLDNSDFPYVRAIVQAGNTPEQQAKRWECFGEYLADYQAYHATNTKADYHPSSFFTKKSQNPVEQMRKSVLRNLLSTCNSPTESSTELLNSALAWTCFSDKEKKKIHHHIAQLGKDQKSCCIS